MLTKSIPTISSKYIPQVGFGLWKVPAAQTADAVYGAIKAGYRHIDGAYGYANSAEAGQGVRRAIAHGLVSREDLFITSKLWNNHHAPAHATRMANEELRAWGLDHLDLYLIHFPIATQWVDPSVSRFPSWHADAAKTRLHPRARVPLADTWRALEALVDAPGVRAGPLRSIGVSNFDAQLLCDLLAYARVPPAVLQVEHHPYLAQPQLVAAARETGVAVTAYSTFGPQSFLELGNPRAAAVPPLMDVPLVKAIAARHGRTPAQQITPLPLKPYDPEEIRKSRKRAATKFSKRRKTFLRRAHDLSQDCQAKVYTFIEYNRRTWVFTSEPDQASFPPTKDEILRIYPLPEIFIPSMFSTLPQVHNDKHDVVDSALSDGFDTHVADQ
ncbi:hypothetical protein HYQ44_012665 [Verticillium longisporum]|nr:hypothetical protein HYQ44_012665 [Verticillium longisporum]